MPEPTSWVLLIGGVLLGSVGFRTKPS
ncbi:MAG: PEP-CTERM sorting domain-containing protein [Aeoliella sp.]